MLRKKTLMYNFVVHQCCGAIILKATGYYCSE